MQTQLEIFHIISDSGDQRCKKKDENEIMSGTLKRNVRTVTFTDLTSLRILVSTIFWPVTKWSFRGWRILHCEGEKLIISPQRTVQDAKLPWLLSIFSLVVHSRNRDSSFDPFIIQDEILIIWNQFAVQDIILSWTGRSCLQIRHRSSVFVRIKTNEVKAELFRSMSSEVFCLQRSIHLKLSQFTS